MQVKRLTIDDGGLAEKVVKRFKGGINHLTALDEFLSQPFNILIGAFEGDQPAGIGIGYCLPRTETDRPMVYIHDINVAVNDRRQGAGREIIGIFKQIARECDALKMFVITDRGNMAGMGLYESTGAKALATDDLVYEWREFTE